MAQKKELNCVVFKSTETEQSHLNTTAESEKNAPTATSAQKKNVSISIICQQELLLRYKHVIAYSAFGQH